MKQSANKFCRLLMDIAYAHGVRSVVCSPGSRNAPLLISANGCDGMRTRVVIDERVAAFIALGEATVSRKPVMLVCTSGTALLNYAPAVAEAYYSGIPLIVVSADRPCEWIDQDDSQTIRQSEALRNFVKKSFDLPVFREDMGKRGKDLEWYVERSVNEAMMTALSQKCGPVHINIQLDNPLGDLVNPVDEKVRVIRNLTPIAEYDRRALRKLAEEAAGKRILLLAGFMQPDHRLQRAVSLLSSFPTVCVMAETVSNLKSAGTRNNLCGEWSCIDPTLWSMSEEEKQAMAPDIVITVGGALVSRQVKEFLRTYRPKGHWAIGPSSALADPLKALTLRIEAEPSLFLNQFAKALGFYGTPIDEPENDSLNYASDWMSLRKRAFEFTIHFAKTAPWSDLKAFEMLASQDWSSFNLFLSNGTSVRYAQLLPLKAHSVFSNRGVSGIDGSTSTALGGALSLEGDEHPNGKAESTLSTLLITGDMSFVYDIGALASGLMPDRMKIILLDNGGGGIFRFIGSTSSLPAPILDRYFCAPPEIDLLHVVEAFGLVTFRAESAERLQILLPEFLRCCERSVLILRTDGEVSGSVLQELTKSIRNGTETN